jgi:flagellar biosynthetic protein FliP
MLVCRLQLSITSSLFHCTYFSIFTWWIGIYLQQQQELKEQHLHHQHHHHSSSSYNHSFVHAPFVVLEWSSILVGVSLFMTLFIMTPVFNDVYQNAVVPYMEQGMKFDKALAAAEAPLRGFMTKQTREDDIALFMQMTRKADVESADQVPFTTLVPAFITSELKSAFTIGFLIYIPFVVIDLIVASVLMSMGFAMLSPMMISMPFKLMLFVLVDGWSLLMGSLAASFVI